MGSGAGKALPWVAIASSMSPPPPLAIYGIPRAPWGGGLGGYSPRVRFHMACKVHVYAYRLQTDPDGDLKITLELVSRRRFMQAATRYTRPPVRSLCSLLQH